MSDLITQLAELIIRDNMILFIGTELQSALGEPSLVEQLTEALARRIDYQRTDRSLPAVARDFEVLHGRRELILVLLNELQAVEQQPSPLYQLVVASMLQHTKVVTTRFDRILERTLEQFQKPYVLIVRDKDVPFFDESKITLIKMQGDINQPDSLVITEDDSDAFISKLPTLSDVIRAFFATKTLVFLGYDLSSDLFKRFFRQVNRNLSVFSRTAYAIVPQPLDEVEARYWENQNVKIYPSEPMAFLEALSKAVKENSEILSISRHSLASQQNSLQEAETLPPRPYKGLVSFTASDRLIFVGRVEESLRLMNRILASRATVLYGESGCGKSSLLAAGVTPLLTQRGAMVAILEPVTDQPLSLLIEGRLIEVAQSKALLPTEATSRPELLATMIRAWQHELDGPIVIAIDQFESFFLRYSPPMREVGIKFLLSLLTDRSLDLRLVLVIRDDFLGALQPLQSQLPKLLEAPFRLQWLSHEAARAAIEEPAKHFKVTWQPALVQRLLHELYEDTKSGIIPPQLQMVCDFLYRKLVEAQIKQGTHSSFEITLAEFEALGGTEAILGNYLDQAVLTLPTSQQPIAHSLLSALVNSTGTKQRLPLPELARAAEIDEPSSKAILEQLSEQLLVRRYEREGFKQPIEYELTHQFLALYIARWLDETFWVVQGAREIVRQALPEWQTQQTMLPPSKWRLVADQRSRLRFSPEEAAMLYAAAVSYNLSPEQWEALLPIPARRAVLLDLLHHTESNARLQATYQLIAVTNHDVCEALVQTSLSDSDPNTRKAAIESLIRACHTDSESRRVAVTLLVEAHKQPATSLIAHTWLMRLRDQQPLIHDILPADMRTTLQREVWWLRWQRHQHHILTTTLRGMQGGFWGLGLGMGLLLVLLDALISLNSITMQAIISLATLGWALAGILGALTAGSAAFVQIVLQTLPDKHNPPRTWAISTLVSTLLMGLGFLLLVYIYSSSPEAKVAIAGLLIGVALTSVATAPQSILQSNRSLHLALAALASVIAFILAKQLGLILRTTNLFASPNILIYIGEAAFELSRVRLQWLMLIIIGLSSGIGFFLGLNRKPSE